MMKLTQVLSFGTWCLILNYVVDVALTSSTDRQLEESVMLRKGPIVRPYSLEDIAKTAPNLRNNHPRLLVFNGQSFAVYNLNHKRQHYRLEDPFPKRSGKIIPLLVHALKELNPNRFLPGQPVFQLLFMDSDSIGTDCFNSGNCPVDDFCPILMFGSTPANETHLPTVKAYPNWFFMDCLYNYKLRGKKHCQWPEHVVPSGGSHHNHKWEDLTPTVVWRGKDFGFLGHIKKFHFSGAGSMDMTNATSPEATADLLLQHWGNLGPRWRAAALTVKAQMHNETWIDAKFVGVNGVAVHKKFEARGVQVVAKTRMEPTEMAHYKYLIDFGGGGGTSWKGGITKLGLPGLLFHHVTPSMDWFFPEMTPWVHYVPVAWDVHNLRERYEWAEKNPKRAKLIADTATKLYHHLMSEAYMRQVYKELFVNYLGDILKAYQHNPPTADASWEETIQEYKRRGFALHQVAVCDHKQCRVPGWQEMPIAAA